MVPSEFLSSNERHLVASSHTFLSAAPPPPPSSSLFPLWRYVTRGYQLHQQLLCELGSHYLLAASSLNHWFHLIDKKIWQPLAKISRGNNELETTAAAPFRWTVHVPSSAHSLIWLPVCPCRDSSLWLLGEWWCITLFYILYTSITCGCGPGWTLWFNRLFN